jgi:hypothetical protein
MKAAKKRVDKLEAKGLQFDFNELLRMEPDGGVTKLRNLDSKLEAMVRDEAPLRRAVLVLH